ncbi:glycerophosphoryl diester phosphodiesterase membrane domain-containing protein [Gordonia sp. (in: high G+C Gram-positive bacteria)]|uniref:glycerophosphoryl diester phosphodiesterase membrane domain-containing protein n=1 Tax=Gordonia sp. (in: high G+C Gram-positive bacteria) TaxID=84139 RepID=UPI001D69574C|nr:glycerophosphoryl diester phosphodiesterase membrane domain-containing protein [Gordonia sp. (in: high G+C Gram-positive bacteria)]MCB1294234.1 glycerophosphoryl diester phosphodiesterase membrane domain-containing protein [Gordonia sp. (in: high G+C Gram-positive bacteria)]HMS76982.1 glycerophosphoryl diester phosphodiesterase membrane domain-containing protein [Gordonia sp. (in: high G+C Gram-positive bacteria)]
MTSNDPIGQGGGQWVAPGSAPDANVVPPAGWSAAPDQASAYPAPPPAPGYPSPGYPGPGWGNLNPMLMHKPGIVPLRPLGAGDILSVTFAAIRGAPRVYFGLVLLMQVATVLLCAVIGLVVVAIAYGSDFENSLAELLIAVGAGGFVLVSSAASGICAGILAYPLNQQAVGRRPGIGETWRMTRRRIPAFLGAFFLIAVGSVALLVPAFAMLAGAIAAQTPALAIAAVVVALTTLVPMVWLAVRVSLTLPALFTENLGPVAALRRSWTLTDGLFWRTLGNLMLMYVIVTVIQSVIQFGFQMISVAVILADSGSESTGAMLASMSIYLLGTIVAIILTQPFMAVVTAVLHLDSRTRKDGFDLDLGEVAAEVAAGQHTGGWPPLSRHSRPGVPYGQPQTPYGQTQVPYGQTQMPYGQTQVPYGQTQMPYGQTQMPYGQAPSPYGQPQYGQPGPYPGQYPPYQQP